MERVTESMLFLLVLASLVAYTSAMTYYQKVGNQGTETYDTDNEFVFFAKFCFDKRGGLIHYSHNLTADEAGNQAISVYSDVEDQWASIKDQLKTMSCEDKVKFSSTTVRLDSFKQKTVSVFSVIPRWWWFVIHNCPTPVPRYFNLSGNLTFSPTAATAPTAAPTAATAPTAAPTAAAPANPIKNGRVFVRLINLTTTNYELERPSRRDGRVRPSTASIFRLHFGFNQQGMFASCIVFIPLQILMLGVFHYTKKVSKRKGRHYEPIKQLAAVVLCGLAARSIELIDFTYFAHTGFHAMWCRGFAALLDSFAEGILLYLLLKVARGWAISTNSLSQQRPVLFVIFVSVLLDVLLYYWSVWLLQSISTQYRYASLPGYLILMARLVIYLWFTHTLRETSRIETDPDKQLFYKKFFGVANIWFLALPVIVLVAVSMKDYHRDKYIYNTVLFARLSIVLFLWLVFRPWGCCRVVQTISPTQQRAFGKRTQQQVFPMSALAAIIDEEANTRKQERATTTTSSSSSSSSSSFCCPSSTSSSIAAPPLSPRLSPP